jgi:hypothetical protein
MADFDIDMKDLELFDRELEEFQRAYPMEARKLMQRSGNEARKIVLRVARSKVKKKKGNYFRSIKRGKVWVERVRQLYKVRVYTAAPHGHLIEYGHRIVGHRPDKPELGYKSGYHVFDTAEKEIEREWPRIIAQEYDRIMDEYF